MACVLEECVLEFGHGIDIQGVRVFVPVTPFRDEFGLEQDGCAARRVLRGGCVFANGACVLGFASFCDILLFIVQRSFVGSRVVRCVLDGRVVSVPCASLVGGFGVCVLVYVRVGDVSGLSAAGCVLGVCDRVFFQLRFRGSG